MTLTATERDRGFALSLLTYAKPILGNKNVSLTPDHNHSLPRIWSTLFDTRDTIHLHVDYTVIEY